MHPAVNTDPENRLGDIRLFLLDMDGTIYLGDRLLPGAREFLGALESTGREYRFLTNNSSKSAADYVRKLNRLGISSEPGHIITSGQATIHHLRTNYAAKPVYLLGNTALKREFREAGIALEEAAPALVVTAFDTELTYERLCRVCTLVRSGLPYIATHPDYNCPMEDGFIPDIGAIHAFIHASTGRWPDAVIGKPNGEIIAFACGDRGYAKRQIAMVGDRLYTDVAAGVNNGITGILVLSGEAKPADLGEAQPQPHLVFDGVADMIPYLQ